MNPTVENNMGKNTNMKWQLGFYRGMLGFDRNISENAMGLMGLIGIRFEQFVWLIDHSATISSPDGFPELIFTGFRVV